MPKPYDDAMKKLVGGNPEDFLSWVLREAIYTQRLPYELHPESIYADGLIEAVLDEERILAHFEFQSSYDLRIGERLLEYNVLASRQYDYVTVFSYVIYLKDCGNVPQSPFIRESRRGKEIVRFHYDIIELHKITAEEIEETELSGLLPLLPLTRDGAKHEVIEEMITRLVAAGQTELLWIGYALAAKIMKHDLHWLRRRFSMLGDFLRDSPVYQEVLEEGLEKGLAKAREETMQQQRRALLDIVIDRFPELVRQAKKDADAIDDPATLLRLIVKMGTVKNVEEAKRLLLALSQEENYN
jgi:predicted transposase/invertase (TIGR01784 family)